MIIKHPMDFGTMRDKIVANEYKSVTEFKVNSFQLLKELLGGSMCLHVQ